LAKDIRENTARLERHELRERTLGEHLKKVLAALEKRMKSQDAQLEGVQNTLVQVQASLQQVGTKDLNACKMNLLNRELPSILLVAKES
jgi:uncharacterized protein (UPF0297 family)